MGDRLSSLRPAGRNLPPSVLETHRYPRTVLLKSGAQLRGVVPLSAGSGKGQNTRATHSGSDVLVGAEGRCRIKRQGSGSKSLAAPAVAETRDRSPKLVSFPRWSQDFSIASDWNLPCCSLLPQRLTTSALSGEVAPRQRLQLIGD
jgi:hypothetical protein